MPIYEYQCKRCEHRFERLQKVAARRIRKCPECGGRVSRLVSTPAIRFKGSGWYLTDYSDKGKKLKEEASKEAPKPKTESASESKKADKPKKSETTTD